MPNVTFYSQMSTYFHIAAGNTLCVPLYECTVNVLSRVDKAKTRYIGALCGLGSRSTPWNAEAVFPDHDMEIAFDFKFDIEDLGLVNYMCGLLNLLVLM
jgi:hypothetical protein